MFDIGIGEIIMIAVVGLLVFGPDRLPRAAADAAKWMRQMRSMATGARKDLADSAGIDLNETVESVKSLRDLHPKRLAAGLMQDDPEPPRKPAAPPPAFDPDAT
jgi:sec-independent protein translocase protein TatB